MGGRSARFGRRGARQAGWVTLELAFAAVGIGVAVVVCAGIFSLALAQLQCEDAAAAIARQAARDDLAAVREIEDTLPDSVTVHTRHEGRELVVSVVGQTRPWGAWLPAWTIQAESRALDEEGGPS